MSPASYRTAPPRVAVPTLYGSRCGGPNRLLQQVQGLRDLGTALVVEPDPLGASALGQGLVGGREVALRLLQELVGLRHVALAVLVSITVVVVRAGVAAGSQRGSGR